MSEPTHSRSDIGEAIQLVAGALRALGTADASTPMGAIELLSMEIRDGTSSIAAAINNLADAVREARHSE